MITDVLSLADPPTWPYLYDIFHIPASYLWSALKSTVPWTLSQRGNRDHSFPTNYFDRSNVVLKCYANRR